MTKHDPRTSALDGVPVLVTGGAGFIGSHLVDALVAAGAVVRVLDDLSNGKRENLAGCLPGVELVVGDIRDLATCRRCCEGTHYVLHQAALGSVPRSLEDPATSIAVNVAGTANVFAAAREAGVTRVVYASSSSVYGDSAELPKREGEEGRPLSPYAASKVMDERLAELFGTCYGIELIGLRYFNVYGPRQDPNGPYAAVIPRFFAACAADDAPVIHGDGGQTRDFTYVADAVAANLKAMLAPSRACGRAYNVACGERSSVNELARLVREAAGKGREAVHTEPRAGDVRHSLADTTAAATELGFTAAVRLAEGLRRAREHYLGEGSARGPAVS